MRFYLTPFFIFFAMKVLRFFPLTSFCVALIFYLCFFTPPQTRLDDVDDIDKLFHFLMYFGTLSFFWWEYWRYTRKHLSWSAMKCFLVAILFPVLMSGMIEIMQEYCTDGRRSGDWADFLANSAGVLTAWFVGRSLFKKLMK